jgi:hypothetical protein
MRVAPSGLQWRLDVFHGKLLCLTARRGAGGIVASPIEKCGDRHAASLLPRGEKDRMRGFGRWSLILNLPNPLTPTLSPLGRGSFLRQLLGTFITNAFVLAARLGARVFSAHE